jgi:hypothetical protein
MPDKVITKEQREQFTELLNEIGPKGAMHLFSGWLNDTVVQGSTYPQYRDHASTLVSTLRDVEGRIQNIRD